MSDAAKLMKSVRMCPARVMRATVTVPSGSDPEKTYEVEMVGRNVEVNCGCPGFKHRRHCKHVIVKEEACGWRSDRSVLREKEKGKCPLCGSETEDRLSGGR